MRDGYVCVAITGKVERYSSRYGGDLLPKREAVDRMCLGPLGKESFQGTVFR